MRLTAVSLTLAGLVLGTVAGVPAIARAAEPPPGELVAHASSACVGSGEDGPRVQLVAVTVEGDPSFGDPLVARVREQAAATDDLLAASTDHPGTARRVRWATDASCMPTVLHRTIPAHDYFGDPAALDTALAGLDLSRADRRTVLVLPWSSLPGTEGRCAQAPVPADTTPGAANTSNTVDPGPVRLAISCWQDGSAVPPRLAHALVHVLGAVHADAPHATGDGHCTTAGDLMCTALGDGASAGGGAADDCVLPRPFLLDCGHDDYYSTQAPPSGSYLATHWNVADSVFLTDGPSLAPNTLTGLSVEGPSRIPAGTPVTLTAHVTDSVDDPGTLRYHWDVANGGRCRVLGPDSTPSIQVTCSSGAALEMVAGVDREDQYGLRTGYLASVQDTSAPVISAVDPERGATVPAGLPLELRVDSTFALPGGTHRWQAPDGCTLDPSGGEQSTARLLCAVGTAGSVRTVQVTAVQSDGQTATAEVPVTLTAAPRFSAPTAGRGRRGTLALRSVLRLPDGSAVEELPVSWWGLRHRKGAPVLLGRTVTGPDGTATLALRRGGLERVWVAGEAPGLVSASVEPRRQRGVEWRQRKVLHRAPAWARRTAHRPRR